MEDKEIFQKVELKEKDENQRTIPGGPTSRSYQQSRKDDMRFKKQKMPNDQEYPRKTAVQCTQRGTYPD